MITKVAYVGVPVRDMERAKRFYGEVLGLRHMFDGAGGKYAELDAPDGKSIGLEQFAPEGSPPYLALETDDLEAEVARLQEAGVEMVSGVTDHSICKMALVRDPEGHVLMLHQIAPERAST